MDESLLSFGPGRHLIGVLTASASHARSSTACLLFNAGVIHRVGPHRINVRIARALASLGVPTLRFDLSGLGDSSPARGGANFRDQAVADLRAAMDALERNCGIRQYVVVGICSGAVNGYWTALADPRVIGLMMFDGFTFPTLVTHVVRRWKRFRTMSWQTRLSRAMMTLGGLFQASDRPVEAGLANGGGSSDIPSRREFANAMDSLLGRGVAVALGYSGSLIEHHNYGAQLRHAFRGAAFLKTIRYDFLPHIDHTVTTKIAQAELIEIVTGWIGEVTSARAYRAEIPTPSKIPVQGERDRTVAGAVG